MPQTQSTTFIQDGLDRVESTLRSLERDWKRLQEKADSRRRDLEKRAEKEVRRIQTELRKSPVAQRAASLGGETRRAVEERLEGLLGSLRIASQADVAKLERKVNALSRKVKTLEKHETGRKTGSSRAA